ncbi:MAG TPA: dodecin family protein [Ktedonobacteraceae bacterium]|nr:dodecin family protein [Ktedonobacteraceae bacterium]
MKLPDMSRQNASTNASKRENASSMSQGNTGIARVAKIIELVGTSDESWEAAAQVAIEEARKTIHNIHGVKIKQQTARVDPETGRIIEYRAAIYLSFGVDDEAR